MNRIGPVERVGQPQPPARVQSRPQRGPDFERMLDALVQERPRVADPPARDGLRLSRHAEARVESRGADVGAEELERVGIALDALAARGARTGLVLTDRSAWVVGVEKRTVITVLSREEARDTVFTDIDATYVAT